MAEEQDSMVFDDEQPDSDDGQDIRGTQSSDSDSDSSLDSEGEAQQNLQIETLEGELATNSYNYDAYVQYIKLLRKTGETEKLRHAREAMSAIFPLSPTMWQEWARDEASLSSGTETMNEIEKLYERGVSDYQSVSLWCDYINFLQEHDPAVSECSPDGISKLRDLFERAITATGLHITQGSRIWDAYRQFEQSILLNIDDTKTEEKEKQVERIRSIFRRQLSVPLANLDLTLHAYNAWEGREGSVVDAESSLLSGIPSHVASAYQKAMEMYNARIHLEEQISRQDILDAERFQQFMNYIRFEQSSGDPARVQVLYERAIIEFPVSSDLWIDYTRYLDKTLKVGKVIRDVYHRATRSCPWVEDLWVRYLLALERSHASEKEISIVFGKALQCSFSTLDEYLDLYLTRIDGLRRRMSANGDKEVLPYSLIKETFQQASDYLSPHMQNTVGLLRLYSYWANLALKLGKDLAEARGVWEGLLKKSGSMLAAWQGYIAMEIDLGKINEARSIYRRCYSRKFDGTGSEDICNAWLQFEREHGTLKDLDRAIQKVTPRLEELQSFRLEQEAKSSRQVMDQGAHALKKGMREKRKQRPDGADERPLAKQQKYESQNLKDVEKETKSEADVKKKVRAKSNALKADSSKEEILEISNATKPKVYTDECTAFISNLNLKAREKDLHNFFSDVGGVLSIRILHDRFSGRSRGLAYVDFVDDEHLAAAIAKNKSMLLGKKLSIARSNPKPSRKEFGVRNIPEKHDPDNQAGSSGDADSKGSKTTGELKVPKTSGDSIKLRGKAAFVPRSVQPIGQTANRPKTSEVDKEKPKSNEEFRNMFIRDE